MKCKYIFNLKTGLGFVPVIICRVNVEVVHS